LDAKRQFGHLIRDKEQNRHKRAQKELEDKKKLIGKEFKTFKCGRRSADLDKTRQLKKLQQESFQNQSVHATDLPINSSIDQDNLPKGDRS
jgi:hypothetical protein